MEFFIGACGVGSKKGPIYFCLLFIDSGLNFEDLAWCQEYHFILCFTALWYIYYENFDTKFVTKFTIRSWKIDHN